jgi:hypothetical protein
MRGRAAVVAVVIAVGCFALVSTGAARVRQSAVWQSWRSLKGVVDIAGVRGDGRFVVAAHGRLFLLRPRDGHLSQYPSSGTPYTANPALEPYAVVAGPRQRVSAAHCAFPPDAVYAIEPAGDTGVLSIGPGGRVRRLASVSGVKTLNGIVFDTGGRFGGRLLVVGLTEQGSGVLVTIDCRGQTRTLTSSAPHLEGGLAIAPSGFGAFGGDVLVPDELDGRLLALAPDGRVADVVDPGQPAGGDIGVESLGVVPTRLTDAYLADRLSPGNANPGHDTILRLSAAALRRAGVVPGDLLATLEGGGTTIDVHCATTCHVRQIATAPAGAHAEGRIAFAGG